MIEELAVGSVPRARMMRGLAVLDDPIKETERRRLMTW